ncbi:hypothetical protein FBU30_007692 [Linnemannia zychae]|nr:hypothetical protein FBU30_007692 [Linnemannia zychae]
MATIRRSRRLEEKDANPHGSAETSPITVATPTPAPTKTKVTARTKPSTRESLPRSQKPAIRPENDTDISPRRVSSRISTKNKNVTNATTNSIQKRPIARSTTTRVKKDKPLKVIAATPEADDNELAPEKKNKSKTSKVKTEAGPSSISTTDSASKPRARQGRKPKDTNDSTTISSSMVGGTTTKASTRKGKGGRTKKEVANDDKVNETMAASNRGRKRKANPEKDQTIMEEDTSALAEIEPASKKQKTNARKTNGNKASAIAVIAVPINKTDPYSVLPTEIWHEVLSYLSLSQITKISVVSKSWLAGIRSLQIWRDICEKSNLGKPKIKFPTHMGLVCSQSYWICEKCFDLRSGRGSDIPLYVEIAELGDEPRMLCRNCRRAYFTEHSEKLRLRKDVTDWYGQTIPARQLRITKSDACDRYGLREDDLISIEHDVRRNPYYRNGPPMRLYLEQQIQKLALSIHGGWVGIKAVTQGTANMRRKAFKLRQHPNQALDMTASQSSNSMASPTSSALKPSSNDSTTTTSTSAKMDIKNSTNTTSASINSISKNNANAISMSSKPDNINSTTAGSDEASKPSHLAILQNPEYLKLIKDAIAEAESRVAEGLPPLEIEMTTQSRVWIDKIRNMVSNEAKRQELIRIIHDLETGV